MSRFNHQWFTSIDDIDATLWNTFFGENPFTEHAFLYALEQSQSACDTTGWQPLHLAIYENQHIIALAPGYLKSHSYGEYVFDWAWAEAFQQHGLAYYPKWLCGSPFSPIEGERVAIRHTQPQAVSRYVCEVLNQQCRENSWSGWHINFCPEQHTELFVEHNAMTRKGVQFQWFNRGYDNFSDFLQSLNARKRKALKKERNKITQQNITIKWLQGNQITRTIMSQFCEFYQRTYLKRSGHIGYLNHEFFILLHALMADKLVIMQAIQDGHVIAATLSFKSENTLYGRYWGAVDEIDCLHFELCYYQGIEYCIANQLHCFHSGAQGEHKIARGFEPVFTHSIHTIINEDFSRAIADFLKREHLHTVAYQQHCKSLLPFKRDV